MLARGDEGAGAGDGELMVQENSLRSHGAAEFPTPPGYGASPRATGATERGREQTAACLAARAVVGFVGCIADALDFGAAVGTGLPVAAVHGHALAECGYL